MGTLAQPEPPRPGAERILGTVARGLERIWPAAGRRLGRLAAPTGELLLKSTRDDVATKASALTFTAFIALFPALLLATSIAGFWLHGREEATIERIVSSIPGLEQLVAQSAQSIVEGRYAAGIIGVLGLLWAASALSNLARRSPGGDLRSARVRGARPALGDRRDDRARARRARRGHARRGVHRCAQPHVRLDDRRARDRGGHPRGAGGGVPADLPDAAPPRGPVPAGCCRPRSCAPSAGRSSRASAAGSSPGRSNDGRRCTARSRACSACCCSCGSWRGCSWRARSSPRSGAAFSRNMTEPFRTARRSSGSPRPAPSR